MNHRTPFSKHTKSTLGADGDKRPRRRFAVRYFTDGHQNHQLEDKRRVVSREGLRLWKGAYKM